MKHPAHGMCHLHVMPMQYGLDTSCAIHILAIHILAIQATHALALQYTSWHTMWPKKVSRHVDKVVATGIKVLEHGVKVFEERVRC